MFVLPENLSEKTLWKILFLAVLFVSFRPALISAQAENIVEIVIRNGQFEFKKSVLILDQPVTLLIINKDHITHGFTAPVFEELEIEVEVGEVITFGKGIQGLHIKGDAMAQIHFAPMRPGTFRFKCDLHPNIKGEMAMLSVGEV